MTLILNDKPIVVPDSVRRKAGLRRGDRVEFKVSGRAITILPKDSPDGEYTNEQRRMIDARLAKADEDIHAGRVFGPFNTASEMAASIEANIKKLRTAKRKVKTSR